MHDTEGGTAESVARYFATDAATGSAHLVVDENACYRTLPNDVIPWAAPGANAAGFHIEQVGYAKWSPRLDEPPSDVEPGGVQGGVSLRSCSASRPSGLSADGLRRGGKGVTTHAECTKAFGGTHTDPGRLWPRTFFMGRVRSYYFALVNAGL
jgi:hypothetical protein